MAQKLPTAKWICCCSVAWSSFSLLLPVARNFSGIMALRFFMGCAEAVIVPALTLIIAAFYKKSEQPHRNAIIFAAISSVVNGFLAWIVGHISENAKLQIWQYLFLITGTLSMLWSIFAFIFMPATPMEAMFLSDREKVHAIRRLAENRTGVTNKEWKWSQALEAVIDPKTWILFLFNMAINVPNGGLTTFSSIIIKGLGFDNLQSSLLNMPTGVCSTISAFVFSWIAARWKDRRCLVTILSCLIPIIGAVLCFKLPQDNTGGQMVGLYFMYTYFGPYCIGISMGQANTAGQTKKNVQYAILYIGYAVGNLIGPQTFKQNQAPAYTGGFTAILVCYCACVALISIYWALAVFLNHRHAENQSQEDEAEEPSAENEASDAFLDLTDFQRKNFSKILIVGAGVFGLSTAFHLAKKGYSDVTVLDKGEVFPSPYSAGNDLNKIMRVEYEDDWYTDLALVSFLIYQSRKVKTLTAVQRARDAWLSDFFAPFYREYGYLVTTSKDAPAKAKKTLQESLDSIRRPGSRIPSSAVEEFTSREELRKIVPQLPGPATEWKGYINRYAGYARAAKAMEAMYAECKKMGVTFLHGASGQVDRLLYKPGKDGRSRFAGVQTADGTVTKADVTMLAMGAHAASVLPSFAEQVEAKSWAVGHVQLTPEEARAMKGIPVINCRDVGFFFEPDDDTNLLKLASNCAGYVNYVDGGNGKKVSLPYTNADDIPLADQQRLRTLLRETFPALADRPLVHKLICWCADTVDSEYVIDWVPGFSGRLGGGDGPSLMMVGGDSGHAFKMLPVVGKWAVEMLENGEQKINRWKWKTHRWDGSTNVSWRVGDVKDIKESLGKGVTSSL
ncbi:hypothetical protein KEM55_006766 [Ascosphaera atra]|nr:hypothetical protein KEM55_006766 [Ascosphaera atra]